MKRSPLVTLTLFTLFIVACDQRPAATESAPKADFGALNAKAPAQDTPVTSQLLGGGGNANLSLQSDGLGVYNNGVSGVSSILQAVLSDWVLDLHGSTRTMSIDFTDALPGNPFAAPFTSALVQPRLIAKASQLNAGSFRGMVGLGSTILSPLDVGAIPYGGKTYAIRMNSTNHPGTNWARVTCLGVVDPINPTTSACNKWEFTPTGNYGGVTKNIGYVEQVARTTSTFIGLFYFTFDFVISK